MNIHVLMADVFVRASSTIGLPKQVALSSPRFDRDARTDSDAMARPANDVAIIASNEGTQQRGDKTSHASSIVANK